METFPAFFPLAGRRIIIAGEGEGADAKARLFAGSPATVKRVSGPEAFEPGAYTDAGLIFVASFDLNFVAAATRAARSAGAPLNVVDHPELSDFHTPAIIDRGQVVAAIGTAGAAPLLASLLRAEVETRVPEWAGQVARLLGTRREALRAAFPDLAQRRAFLRAFLAGEAAASARGGDLTLAETGLDAALAAGWTALGKVFLILAPAAADLLSVRAVRALNTADIVAFDPDVGGLVSAHARRDAEHWPLARATAEALGEQALAGRLLAVIAERFDPDLSRALKDGAVTLETLAPAPAA